MHFEIVGEIEQVAVIASGLGIRERKRLWKTYGRGAWRKRKGVAAIKLAGGARVTAELHWAHGIGKKEFKIKRILAQAG